MGIKKLFTFLNNNSMYKVYPYINDLISELKLKKTNTIIGVDGNLFCYKYAHSYDNMLIGFFNQIIQFLSNSLLPLYIFDGGTIQEKENTNHNRSQKKQFNKVKLEQIEEHPDEYAESDSEYAVLKKKYEKNTIRIKTDEINILLELFDLLNIPYIFSYGEGEYLAVMLNQYGIIDMFLTDDTDPIPAGIVKTIKFYNNGVYYLNTEETLEKLLINKNEFIDFCILLGSDYSLFHHGYKPNELFELIKTHKCIENIIIEKIENKQLVNIELINKIRKIYRESGENERMFFTNPNATKSNYNFIIDHSNYNFYSNIMLEFWDEFLEIISKDLKEITKDMTELFKNSINNYVRQKKFNIKNIVKFLKNNIPDISDKEISNAQITFEYLNSFGF